MTVKHECSEKAYHSLGNWGQWSPCSRNATVESNGKWYCRQHDPQRIAADRKKRRANQEIKQKVLVNLWKRRVRNARLAALVTPELAVLLEQMADYAREAAHAAKGSPDDVDAAYIAEETARELAAQIREVR